MLVRLGSPDSVPAGLRIVRAAAATQTVAREPGLRALPSPSAGAAWSAQGDAAQAFDTAPEPSSHVLDARHAQRVRDAYGATDPIQPRPGLIIRVRA